MPLLPHLILPQRMIMIEMMIEEEIFFSPTEIDTLTTQNQKELTDGASQEKNSNHS